MYRHKRKFSDEWHDKNGFFPLKEIKISRREVEEKSKLKTRKEKIAKAKK